MYTVQSLHTFLNSMVDVLASIPSESRIPFQGGREEQEQEQEQSIGGASSSSASHRRDEDGSGVCAEELQELGNQLFREGHFEEAIPFFSKALRLQPEHKVLYSNRSAANVKLGQWEYALDDAVQCTEIDPEWWKVCVPPPPSLDPFALQVQCTEPPTENRLCAGVDAKRRCSVWSAGFRRCGRSFRRCCGTASRSACN